MYDSPAPLHGLDLNLLITLRALLRTSSVTGAAELLGQSQPTVSRSLATLRGVFDDPLLVRAGRGMARTPFAEALKPRLETTLEALDMLPTIGTFDPSTARRTWRVVSPDLVALALQPAILARMQCVAPLSTVQFTTAEGEPDGLLLAHQADLAVGSPSARPELAMQKLPPCGTGWSIVFARNHRLAESAPTLESWLACRHVELSADGPPASHLDALLESHGMERFVAATFPTMSSLAETLARTDLVASLPTPVASRLAQDARLQVLPHPFGAHIPPLRVSMVWHRLHEDDPAHRWFRGELQVLLEGLLTPK